MEELAKLDRGITVVHHKTPHGLGRTFREGLSRSRFPWLTLIPGDNAFHAAGIERMFEAVGTAGMVMTYRDNQAIRSLSRSLQSHALRSLINLLFGFRARDLHSMNVYPVSLLRKLGLTEVGYGYQLEAVISLLRTGLTYQEVPVSLNPEIRGSSRALQYRNYLALGQVILRQLFRPATERRGIAAVGTSPRR
jgi:hypothetical protein